MSRSERGLAALLSALLTAAALGPGCAKETTTTETGPRLSLVRAADGAFELTVRGAPQSPRALEAHVLLEGADDLELVSAAAPIGLPLDRVRAANRGGGRAILFAGDTRGVRGPRDGALARFSVRRSGGGVLPEGGRLRIERAVLVGADGRRIEASLGPGLPLR